MRTQSIPLTRGANWLQFDKMKNKEKCKKDVQSAPHATTKTPSNSPLSPLLSCSFSSQHTTSLFLVSASLLFPLLFLSSSSLLLSILFHFFYTVSYFQFTDFFSYSFSASLFRCLSSQQNSCHLNFQIYNATRRKVLTVHYVKPSNIKLIHMHETPPLIHVHRELFLPQQERILQRGSFRSFSLLVPTSIITGSTCKMEKQQLQTSLV